MATAKIIELNDQNICRICENHVGKYTCPRCSTLYCSITCYRSQKHAECSETFYKDCVMKELSSGNFDPESKRKMQEILSRHYQNNQGMDVNQEDDQLDSDDDDDLPDLSDRLKNVDLDDVDKIWNLLGDHEKQEFEALVRSGDITKLVPVWVPWWENKIEKKLVEDVNAQHKVNYQEQCPTLLSKIKTFSEISKMEPSESVKFNLFNVLASYVCVVRYFNGDHFEFSKEAVYLLTHLSLNLHSNTNFESFTSALESVYHMCLANDWITVDPEHKDRMYKDVRNMAEGPEEQNSTYYIKAALSDMHRLMTVSKKGVPVAKSDNEFTKRFLNNELPENKIVSRENLRNYIRKIEYYLSYVTSFECTNVL